MSEKWYVVKVSEENIEKNIPHDSYVITRCYDGLDKEINRFGDTIILTTPSEEIARNVKRALDEQLQEQSY